MVSKNEMVKKLLTVFTEKYVMNVSKMAQQ